MINEQLDEQIDKILTHLMEYSFDYGAGIIPTSENPPLIIARHAKQHILHLISIEIINSQLDELVVYSNHVGLLHEDWEEYEDKRKNKLENRIKELKGGLMK